jgi:hypothetical protein
MEDMQRYQNKPNTQFQTLFLERLNIACVFLDDDL